MATGHPRFHLAERIAMHTDADFLQMLLADPADDTTRLVYADWLEEQGDAVSAAKSEFLRLTVQLAAPRGTKAERKKKEKRLQELAAVLEDTGWLAVVSRLPIENCLRKGTAGERRPRSRVNFDYLCDRQWEDLRPTGDTALRFCDACRQNVHYCDTITEARKHAEEGHCIAVDLGVIRRERDLEPEMMWVGQPSAEFLQQERERVQPDPVSAERERRKREKNGKTPPEADNLTGYGIRVRVRDGTFAGMEGEVVALLEERHAVRVELTLFGRQVPVELELWQVEPV
jgi:uncharacterized protein (TIGR02996 family)